MGKKRLTAVVMDHIPNPSSLSCRTWRVELRKLYSPEIIFALHSNRAIDPEGVISVNQPRNRRSNPGRSKDMAADSDKTMIRVIGLVLLVGGIGFAYWGYQMSHSFASNVTRAFTGSLPDGVMYRYIGGAISGVAGLFLLVKK